jgi:hypothetical protein
MRIPDTLCGNVILGDFIRKQHPIVGRMQLIVIGSII